MTKGYTLMKTTSILLISMLLLCGFTLAATAAERLVKVIYFVPNDRPIQLDIPSALDMQMKNVQAFYADQLEAHGYGRKTFKLGTDTNGKVVVHVVIGQHGDVYYHTDTLSKIEQEIKPRYDIGTYIFIVIVDISTERVNKVCGIARFDGGPVLLPASGGCVEMELTAHELGHALNLEHDFRDQSYIMSYGATRDKLSACAASMLNVSPFFNNIADTGNTPATIQMLTASTYPANEENWTLRFNVSDVDGVYQVQFLLSVPGEPTSVMSCQNFNSPQSTNVEFDMPTGATIAPVNNVYIRVVDQNGYVFGKSWTINATKTTETKTTDTDRTETYLTLNYDSPDALVPINNPTEWTWWGPNNHITWEKTPDGLLPRRPNGFMDLGSIQYYSNWDYWFYGHAPGKIVYDLKNGDYTKFDAVFDMPNTCGNIASVEVICFADDVEIYNSGVLIGSQSRNKNVTFDIPKDTQTLTINVTDAGNGNGCDHFVFANAKLLYREITVIEADESTGTKTTDTDRTETYLTLNYDSPDALVPINNPTEWTWWGPNNHITWEKTPDGLLPRRPNGFMDLGSIQYYSNWDYWFYGHAPGKIVYDLKNGDYTKFDAVFDMPNTCGHIASVEVISLADDVEIYNSSVLIGSQSRNKNITFEIPKGTQKLTISITDAPTDGTHDIKNWCDHFIFANAKLVHREPTVIEVDDYNHTDINNDGVVNIIDLVLVAVRYGEKIVGNPFPNPDVNRDGIVDVNDIILVTQDMPPVAGAPSLSDKQRSVLTSTDWQEVYAALPDTIVDRGIAVLNLLFGAVVPTKTLLLENFPNPFNPETWIPYQLAKPSEVKIMIYDVRGRVVRQLKLGHQAAGVYRSRSKAAYWDGRNHFGEKVASDVYFYTFKAGNYTATRKMLIRK